jgi:hypothetical protein
MTTFPSFFNLFTLIAVLPYALGIASLIMITISLIYSARVQRSIASSLERMEKLLEERE